MRQLYSNVLFQCPRLQCICFLFCSRWPQSEASIDMACSTKPVEEDVLLRSWSQSCWSEHIIYELHKQVMWWSFNQDSAVERLATNTWHCGNKRPEWTEESKSELQVCRELHMTTYITVVEHHLINAIFAWFLSAPQGLLVLQFTESCRTSLYKNKTLNLTQSHPEVLSFTMWTNFCYNYAVIFKHNFFFLLWQLTLLLELHQKEKLSVLHWRKIQNMALVMEFHVTAARLLWIE